MDRRYFFERNLLALATRNPALCSRLSGAETTLERYRFLETRSGDTIPAMADRSGAAHPLHSTVDPRREAERLVSTLKDEGFLVFLGLGGGYAPEAVLGRADVSHILIIDYDINGIAELFCAKEYIKLLGDPRCSLLIDPAPGRIEEYILEQYRPALSGGIRTVPLRARTELDAGGFGAAAIAIQRALERVSSDYSVQAYFGNRWFSNIIRNLAAAEAQNVAAPRIREAAICAAGPSLDQQIPLLADCKAQAAAPKAANCRSPFIIAADTALPALLHAGLAPDAVVSIDCQHISYYHFIGAPCGKIPLFLDIASPPLLAGRSAAPFFFSGGHPLAQYISRYWRRLPCVDTSGGNVTYACLSLAEQLGADRITVYGADFSYPQGRVYARGTYLYPFFENRQNRRLPVEAQFSAFLYRSPFLPPEEPGGGTFFETATMRQYRKRFEQKAESMNVKVTAAAGLGAPIHIRENKRGEGQNGGGRVIWLFAPGKALMSAASFLEQYRDAISDLPLSGLALPGAASAYPWNFSAAEAQVFTTLLPQAAALKRRQPELKAAELIEAVRAYSIEQIDRVLQASGV